jgi:hypothetical protein
MSTTGETCGILFVATGERYVEAALRAAENVRRHIPELPLAIQTDRPEAIPAQLLAHVQVIEGGHARSKVDCLIRSPFDRTLYLDTDTRVLEDVSDMFRLLDRFDIALTHAHARNRRQTRETWQVELPDCFPQLNGGVILYRRTDEVLRFLSDWSRSYKEAGFRKDQVTLRELVWTSGLRLYVLPPEYNVRYLRYAYFWASTEARPRILHLRRYHDPGQGIGRIVGDRVREVRADLGAAFRALGGALKQAMFLGGRATP